MHIFKEQSGVLIARECPDQSDPESAHPLPTPALSVEGAGVEWEQGSLASFGAPLPSCPCSIYCCCTRDVWKIAVLNICGAAVHEFV